MNMHSKNPVISRIDDHTSSYAYSTGETASFTGIASKTGILLAIIIGISAFIWMNFESMAGIIMPLFIASTILGFVSVLLAQLTKATPFFTVLYAVCEGVFLGTFTYIVQAYVEPGLVFNAITITFVILGFLLVAYSTGLFKVGFRFRKIVYTAMFSIVVFFLLSAIMRLFGVNLFGGMSIGMMIALTVGMVILASFNILIDFDDSKRAVDSGVAKRFEWNLALGLLVSLIWLYVEVLRLLILLAARARD
jgi:uncharacterized YccA/Bax inhibitor family protein